MKKQSFSAAPATSAEAVGLAAGLLGMFGGIIVSVVFGLVLIVKGITADPADAWQIAWGVAFLLLSKVVGFFACVILGAIGGFITAVLGR